MPDDSVSVGSNMRAISEVAMTSLALARVIGPVHRRLPLLAAAFDISGLAVLADGGHMTPNGAPPANLPRVVGAAPAQVVAAVPLEPAARILGTDPAVPPPRGERLRRVDAETVQARVVSLLAQLRVHEPAGRELLAAVVQVFPAEHAEAQHLLRRELRRESLREVPARRFGAEIHVAPLHGVVDHDSYPRGVAPRTPKHALSLPLVRAVAAHLLICRRGG